jgi:DprA winged helix domain
MKGVAMLLSPDPADDSAELDDARRMIVRRLNRDPYDVWTRDSLARTIGLPTGVTARVLAELVSGGMVRRVPGADEEFSVVGDDY